MYLASEFNSFKRSQRGRKFCSGTSPLLFKPLPHFKNRYVSKHKNSVIFLKDWKPLIKALPESQQIIFWDLFMMYECGINSECNDPIVLPTWTFIKSQLDKFDENYQTKIVERNKENGKKGGRPKGKPKETQHNPNNPVGKTITQITLKENENKNVNDNENHIYIESEKVFDLNNWFETHRGIWANDFPKRQKFNLKEMSDLFMLDKSQQTFNDANHIQNSFVIFIGQEKKVKENGSGQKKSQTDEALEQIERMKKQRKLNENQDG